MYDTRLEKDWLTGLLRELHPALKTEQLAVVGGDVLTKPTRDDAVLEAPCSGGALADRRRTTSSSPRPHLQRWLDRCHQQLAVEAQKAVFSVCAVVDRDKCPTKLDAAALRRLLPQAGGLLSDMTLEVQVAAVGERPRLIRVPAGELELPPSNWETAYFAANKVLVVISFRRHSKAAVHPAACWVRGALKPPEPSALELLRVEYLLPPATSKAVAEKRFGRRSGRSRGPWGWCFMRRGCCCATCSRHTAGSWASWLCRGRRLGVGSGAEGAARCTCVRFGRQIRGGRIKDMQPGPSGRPPSSRRPET